MEYGNLHKEMEELKEGLNLSVFILDLIKSGSHGKCKSTKVYEARGENSAGPVCFCRGKGAPFPEVQGWHFSQEGLTSMSYLHPAGGRVEAESFQHMLLPKFLKYLIS